MKKYIKIFLLIICAFIWSDIYAYSGNFIGITGAVRQPLNLHIEDINRYQTVRVQLNEVIMKDGAFKGVFYYSGVPLRTLLEVAYIEKEDSACFYSLIFHMPVLIKKEYMMLFMERME